jgi:quercetin dioxygenase-like cupin family protein
VDQHQGAQVADLEKGITRAGEGYQGKSWNILGQRYFPKASTDSSFAFETNSEPGQHVPVHIHPTQDEFILVLEGELDLKLDGVWSKAKAGDLVRMPRGVPHGYFNKSDAPARALFWVSPAGNLRRSSMRWTTSMTFPACCSCLPSMTSTSFLLKLATEERGSS